MIKIKKKDGSLVPFDGEKIKIAISKSAERANIPLAESEKQFVADFVRENIENNCLEEVEIAKMHNFVECALERVNPLIAKSYRDFRNYKQEFVAMMEEEFANMDKILFVGDKENANKDSALVSTKGCLIRSHLTKEYYKKTFLTDEERKIIAEGQIYIHDMDLRPFTMNCCLFDMKNVLEGGFEMGNVWYNEPKTLDVAGDVIGDIVLSAASQQYGGFTIPQVDEILEPYAKKSWNKHYEDAKFLCKDEEKLKEYADKLLAKEIEQVFQGWEIKFNTVGSSRGDYPFITVTLGLNTSEIGQLICETAFKVHMGGQGAPGHKKPVLFPKYVFLFDKNIHGKGKEAEKVYEAALECSGKTMYPDWLSLTGEGYVPSMYKKYGAVISPMGCRAFLSPWYERGGLEPADENDKPVFIGRFNSGAISLNLPMIYLEAVSQNRMFYDTLDYYLEVIRKIHKRTKVYLGNLRASINPLAFCQGGFYGGNLRPDQKLRESDKLLPSTTWSFGITALNELQMAYNGKSIVEDGQFALQVMEYINEKLAEFKKEDQMLYAVYGTPAENLCGKQIEQLRNYAKNHFTELEKAGYKPYYSKEKDVYMIDGICDREYVSNSFHCHVSEDITPIQKQDLEERFWNLFNGGKIQYVRYPVGYNKAAMETLVNRAMDKGYYEGVNLALNFCDECGHEEIDMSDTCPCCGSKNITKIDRMNGYLAYSRVKGDTRLNDAKMAEIAERKSM